MRCGLFLLLVRACLYASREPESVATSTTYPQIVLKSRQQSGTGSTK